MSPELCQRNIPHYYFISYMAVKLYFSTLRKRITFFEFFIEEPLDVIGDREKLEKLRSAAGVVVVEVYAQPQRVLCLYGLDQGIIRDGCLEAKVDGSSTVSVLSLFLGHR